MSFPWISLLLPNQAFKKNRETLNQICRKQIKSWTWDVTRKRKPDGIKLQSSKIFWNIGYFSHERILHILMFPRRRIKSEWELSFRSKFDRFTEKYPSHKWIMSLEKVTKKHPLRREKRWEHFLGEKVEAGFKCSVIKRPQLLLFYFVCLFLLSLTYFLFSQQCGDVWESKRAWISFWIWQNPPNSEGKRIGEVAVHVLGQKCIKCPGNANVCLRHSFYMHHINQICLLVTDERLRYWRLAAGRD